MLKHRAAAVAVIAAGAALAASACSSASDWEYTPSSGTVVEKEHDPYKEWEECGYDSVYNSRTGRYDSKWDCDTEYEEECWEIDYETPDGDVLEDCVDKSMYDQLEVGMVYTEGQSELATSTPWLTPSPSPSSSVPAAESS